MIQERIEVEVIRFTRWVAAQRLRDGEFTAPRRAGSITRYSFSLIQTVLFTIVSNNRRRASLWFESLRHLPTLDSRPEVNIPTPFVYRRDVNARWV